MMMELHDTQYQERTYHYDAKTVSQANDDTPPNDVNYDSD